MSPVIETHSLTKSYGKSRGIEDVNLAVEKGEVFGFIGPNGAGKSTTIRTLLGFLKPTSGSAKVLGYDVVEESREIHKRIGYLPADVSLYDDMTAGELLDLSAKFHDVDGSDKIKELSSRLDLNLSKKFRSLSTGNKKKVGIIQTILHDPDLLIFDEPTSGLDPLVQNTFYEILRNEAGRWQDRLLLVPRPQRGAATLQQGRDHQGGQACRGRGVVRARCGPVQVGSSPVPRP